MPKQYIIDYGNIELGKIKPNKDMLIRIDKKDSINSFSEP